MSKFDESIESIFNPSTAEKYGLDNPFPISKFEIDIENAVNEEGNNFFFTAPRLCPGDTKSVYVIKTLRNGSVDFLKRLIIIDYRNNCEITGMFKFMKEIYVSKDLKIKKENLMVKFDELIDSIFTTDMAAEYVYNEFPIPSGTISIDDMVNKEGSKYFFHEPSRNDDSTTATYIINCMENGKVVPILKRILTFNLEDPSDVKGMFRIIDLPREEILDLIKEHYPEDAKNIKLDEGVKTKFDEKIESIFNPDSSSLEKLNEFDVSSDKISLKDMRNACANQYFFLVDKFTDGDDHIFEIFDKNSRHQIKLVLTFKSDGTIKGQYVIDFEEEEDDNE